MLEEAFRNMGDGVYMQSRQSADLTSMSPDRLTRQILYSELYSGHKKERVPSSPFHGYHQDKPEVERHKYRLMDITLKADR